MIVVFLRKTLKSLNIWIFFLHLTLFYGQKYCKSKFKADLMVNCRPPILHKLQIQNPFNTFVSICTGGTRDFWLNPLPSEYHLGFLGLFWTALPMHCGLIPQQQTSRCWSCSVTEVSKIKKHSIKSFSKYYIKTEIWYISYTMSLRLEIMGIF